MAARSRVFRPAGLAGTALAAVCCAGGGRDLRDTATAGPGAGTPAPVPAPVPAPAPASCGDALRVAFLSADAGAGQRGVTYTLTNAGPTRCTVGGHPRVELRDAAGQALPSVVVERVTDDSSATRVTLAPGAQAAFALTYTGIPADGRPCVESAAVTITPPDAVHGTTLPARFSLCATRRVRVRAVAARAAGRAESSGEARGGPWRVS